jgi:hypothetical protein
MLPRSDPRRLFNPRHLLNWLQPIALILAAAAIVWFLIQQWPALTANTWRWQPGWFVAASLLTLAAWSLEITIWRSLLGSLGSSLTWWPAVRIWFLSAVVRYIPGNIWQPLSITLYNHRRGIPPTVTVTSLVLFQMVTILAVAPITVAYFTWLDTQSAAAQWMAQLPRGLLWLGLLPVIVFLARPQWLIVVLNWGLARLGRAPLRARLTSASLLGLTVLAVAHWLIWGAAFAAFAFTFVELRDPAALLPLLIAAYPIGYAIGFLSLISPSGFGVREGALLLLLSPPLEGGVVALIALGSRIWTMIGELLLALVSAPRERATAPEPLATDLPTAAVVAEPRLHRPST